MWEIVFCFQIVFSFPFSSNLSNMLCMVSTCNCRHTSSDPINICVGSKSCSRTSSGMLLHADGWHFPFQTLKRITFTNTRIELNIIYRKQCIRLVLAQLYTVQPIQTMPSFQLQLFQRSQPRQPTTHWQHVSAELHKHSLIAWIAFTYTIYTCVASQFEWRALFFFKCLM